jgi:hypothetical protein
MFLSVVVVLVVFVGLIFEAYWVIAIPAVLLLVKWLNKEEPDPGGMSLSPEEVEELKKRFREL